MALLGTLRGQLDAKGYERITHPTLSLTLHIHPLVTAPVLLSGIDATEAKDYQQELIDSAIRKR